MSRRRHKIASDPNSLISVCKFAPPGRLCHLCPPLSVLLFPSCLASSGLQRSPFSPLAPLLQSFPTAPFLYLSPFDLGPRAFLPTSTPPLSSSSFLSLRISSLLPLQGGRPTLLAVHLLTVVGFIVARYTWDVFVLCVQGRLVCS